MKYYIITGESSGDMHAANLVAQIKNMDSKSVFRAWGGRRLIAHNVSIAKNISETSFMGFLNVLKNFRRVRSNFNFCKQDILDFSPDALILVDYPAFNLQIAKFCKKKGLKVFYYISPKVWAWNKNRVSKIKNFVDHLLVIFPFEVDFYKQYGINAIYVGNPLLDEIQNTDCKLSFNSSKPIIALLPGSRKQEIDYVLPEMLKIVNDFQDYQFVIAATNEFKKDYYEAFIEKDNILIVFNETYALLSNSIAAIVTSGTASLEVALFSVPQVVCYKTNWITYIIAKVLINIEHLSLVNILLKKTVVKELIQNRLNKKNLKAELDIMIKDKDKFIKDYNSLRNLLNKKGASSNAAKFIIDSI